MNVDIEDTLRGLAPRLFRYAIGRTGNAGLAEDVAQECLTALRKLPGRDREVLLLVVGGELNTLQAAKTLGISTSALKVRMLRARRRLAALLEDDDDAQA